MSKKRNIFRDTVLAEHYLANLNVLMAFVKKLEDERMLSSEKEQRTIACQIAVELLSLALNCETPKVDIIIEKDNDFSVNLIEDACAVDNEKKHELKILKGGA